MKPAGFNHMSSAGYNYMKLRGYYYVSPAGYNHMKPRVVHSACPATCNMFYVFAHPYLSSTPYNKKCFTKCLSYPRAFPFSTIGES